jgi:hypothetical protein
VLFDRMLRQLGERPAHTEHVAREHVRMKPRGGRRQLDLP